MFKRMNKNHRKPYVLYIFNNSIAVFVCKLFSIIGLGVQKN